VTALSIRSSYPDLSGKVAVVTGGSLGIGRAAAIRLASDGAHVVVFGHQADDVERVATEVLDNGGSATGVVGDIAIERDVERLVDSAKQTTGRVDVLVSSAGIQHYGTVEHTGVDDWDRVLAVNLKGVYLAARHVIPVMRGRGGAIVNVSSVQAISAQPGVAAYAASKGGVISLTTAMAVDHAPDGIRVNAVLPGSVDTPMLRSSARKFADGRSEDSVLESWGQAHPLGRVARAEEIAELIAFLASHASSFLTGAAIRADGGLLSQLGAAIPSTAD
jgi:NAD(P)-dependent dehydrogenase (short-subunit alcohol dehydrogenase family)